MSLQELIEKAIELLSEIQKCEYTSLVLNSQDLKKLTPYLGDFICPPIGIDIESLTDFQERTYHTNEIRNLSFDAKIKIEVDKIIIKFTTGDEDVGFSKICTKDYLEQFYMWYILLRSAEKFMYCSWFNFHTLFIEMYKYFIWEILDKSHYKSNTQKQKIKSSNDFF